MRKTGENRPAEQVAVDAGTSTHACTANQVEPLAARAAGHFVLGTATPEKDVRRLFRELDGLFGQLAHSARNQMSPLLGYASMLEAHGAPREREWARKIAQGLRVMESSMRRLETYRTAGALEAREVKWNAFLAEVVDGFKAIDDQRIPVHTVNRVRGIAVVNAELLKRALFHVLRNASEATPPGKAITLRVDPVHRRQNARPGVVRVSVIDEGAGIPESELDAIWRPFYSTRLNHFGLGLPYVRMAASILDAGVGVRSTANFGTTFWIEIKPQGGSFGAA